MPITRAAVANRSKLQGLLPEGELIHPFAFQWEPQGCRILVVLDKAPEKVGLIAIPDTIRDREKMGQGLVMAAGPLVGGDSAHPGNVQCDTPEDLLYRRVIFGSNVGKFLRFPAEDRQYTAEILLMSDRDLWCVVWES